MRGVYRSGTRWIAHYKNKYLGSYEDKINAENVRLEAESSDDIPLWGVRRKNYTGEFGSFSIIGDTGETKNKVQRLIVRNQINGEVFVSDINSLRNSVNGLHGLGSTRNSPTGSVGVFKSGKKFKAKIGIQGIQYNLGTYCSIPEAEKAYENALNDWLTNRVKPRKPKKRNKILPKGISKTKYDTYLSFLSCEGKTILRKTFKTLPEAEQALEYAKQQLKETN